MNKTIEFIGEVICIIAILIIYVMVLIHKYKPSIDIIVQYKRYMVLLWYNKWYCSEEYERTYIILFEV